MAIFRSMSENLFFLTRNRPVNGFYFAIDGVPGVGKTTKTEIIRNELVLLGLKAKNLKRESTHAIELGKVIFPFLKGNGKFQMCQGTNPRTMSLLIQAYCNELYEKEIVPQLASGGVIISDRDDILTTSVLQPVIEFLNLEVYQEDLFNRVNNYFSWFSDIFFTPDLTMILCGNVEAFLIRASYRDYIKRKQLYKPEEINIIRTSYDLFVWSSKRRNYCQLIDVPLKNETTLEKIVETLPSSTKEFDKQPAVLQQLDRLEEFDKISNSIILRLVLKQLCNLHALGRHINGFDLSAVSKRLESLL